MALKPVAQRTDFDTRDIVEITVENKKVILVKYQDGLKAFQGYCPHQGASLAQGHVEKGHIVCPLHRYMYSVETGKHNFSTQCLKSYKVVEEDGKIFIDADEFAPEPVKRNTTKPRINSDTLPSPPKHFILGHLPEFKSQSSHLVAQKWIKETGNLFRINFAGKRVIVSADPDVNRQILKSRPHDFRRFYKISEVMEEMGVLGAFNAEGKTWEHHRKLTAEALNFKNTKSYFPTIVSMTDRLLRRWRKVADNKQPIDVQKELMRYTVDITTTIAFGYDTKTLERDDDVIQQHLEKIFPMIHKRITAPIPYWRFIKFKKDKELLFALSEIEKQVNHFISMARERLKAQPSLRENPTNFLEALLVEQQKTGNFTDKEVFGNVLTILLAGEDTTSNTISWILYFLAINPKITDTIRSEVERVCGDKLFPDAYEEVSKLKYTEAVAMEAIRIKPVAPFLYVQALTDTVVNGIEIKKGSVVMVNVQAAHLQEENFGDPDKFLPERWINGKCPFPHAHKSEVIQTFGSGPRYCPGKNLAMLEMVIAVAMICKNFNFEFAMNPEAIEEVCAFTMYPKNLLLSLKKRPVSVVEKEAI